MSKALRNEVKSLVAGCVAAAVRESAEHLVVDCVTAVVSSL